MDINSCKSSFTTFASANFKLMQYDAVDDISFNLFRLKMLHYVATVLYARLHKITNSIL